tara:strand:+ start:10 stop:114 length:105 start_codon:yes stop_codon:yes gene_type:complete
MVIEIRQYLLKHAQFWNNTKEDKTKHISLGKVAI